ncbi:MAG: hypothetical protein JXQ74_00660 [Alphaproteobacteria bacterium]|nr:hypothetical protein [Alphaproteobacteria bacterium]
MTKIHLRTLVPVLAEEFAIIADADKRDIKKRLENMRLLNKVLGLRNTDIMTPEAFDLVIKNRVAIVNEKFC